MIHVPQDVAVLAVDVHKSTISAAILDPGSVSPVVDKISSDDEMVRRLVRRFPEPRRVVGLLRGRADGLRARSTAELAGRAT